jgi:hypothetical protein
VNPLKKGVLIYRVIKSSLEDIQSKYDKATEEVALLQAEVASAETLRIENQRLKDELRDLKEEWTLLKEKVQSQPMNEGTPSPSSRRHYTPPSPPISENTALTPNTETTSPPKPAGVLGLGGVGGTGTWRGVRRGAGKRTSIASDVSWTSEMRQPSSIKIMHDMVSRVKVSSLQFLLTLESGSSTSGVSRPCESLTGCIAYEGSFSDKRTVAWITREISREISRKGYSLRLAPSSHFSSTIPTV